MKHLKSKVAATLAASLMVAGMATVSNADTEQLKGPGHGVKPPTADNELVLPNEGPEYDNDLILPNEGPEYDNDLVEENDGPDYDHELPATPDNSLPEDGSEDKIERPLPGAPEADNDLVLPNEGPDYDHDLVLPNEGPDYDHDLLPTPDNGLPEDGSEDEIERPAPELPEIDNELPEVEYPGDAEHLPDMNEVEKLPEIDNELPEVEETEGEATHLPDMIPVPDSNEDSEGENDNGSSEEEKEEGKATHLPDMIPVPGDSPQTGDASVFGYATAALGSIAGLLRRRK